MRGIQGSKLVHKERYQDKTCFHSRPAAGRETVMRKKQSIVHVLRYRVSRVFHELQLCVTYIFQWEVYFISAVCILCRESRKASASQPRKQSFKRQKSLHFKQTGFWFWKSESNPVLNAFSFRCCHSRSSASSPPLPPQHFLQPAQPELFLS